MINLVLISLSHIYSLLRCVYTPIPNTIPLVDHKIVVSWRVKLKTVVSGKSKLFFKM